MRHLLLLAALVALPAKAVDYAPSWVNDGPTFTGYGVYRTIYDTYIDFGGGYAVTLYSPSPNILYTYIGAGGGHTNGIVLHTTSTSAATQNGSDLNPNLDTNQNGGGDCTISNFTITSWTSASLMNQACPTGTGTAYHLHIQGTGTMYPSGASCNYPGSVTGTVQVTATWDFYSECTNFHWICAANCPNGCGLQYGTWNGTTCNACNNCQ